MTLVMALFALALRDLLGRYLIGMQAKTNLVHQLDFAMQLLHSQIIISWLVLNWAPSVKNFTWFLGNNGSLRPLHIAIGKIFWVCCLKEKTYMLGGARR